MVGQPVTMPLGIAPTGLTVLLGGDREINCARAAQAFRVPFCLNADYDRGFAGANGCAGRTLRTKDDAPSGAFRART